MTKFTFTCEEKPRQYALTFETNAKRTVEFEAVSLDVVISEFELFLKGAGFIFDGTLDIVPIENIEEYGKQLAPEEC